MSDKKSHKSSSSSSSDDEKRVKTTTSGKITFHKLEVPFDLEQVFTLQYNVDGLKGVLKFILEHLGQYKNDLDELNLKMLSKLLQVDKNKDGVAQNKEDIEALKKICKELENKSVYMEEKVSDLNANQESMQVNMTLNQRNTMMMIDELKDNMGKQREDIDRDDKRITELENKIGGLMGQIEALKALGGGSGGSVDLSGFEKLFAKLDPPHNTIKRIEALEKLVGDDDNHGNVISRLVKLEEGHLKLTNNDLVQDKDIDELKKKLAALEEKINNLPKEAPPAPAPIMEIKGEVDTSMIMQQINALRVDINKKADQHSLDALRAELKSYTDEEVAKALGRFKDDLSNLRNLIEMLRAEFETFKDRDFADHTARISALEKKIIALQQQIANSNKGPAVVDHGPGVDEGAHNALEARVRKLEEGLDDLRNQFSRWMKEVQDSLNLKLEEADLKPLEQSILERINDIVKALTKQFADKAETKKALKLLERQIRNLYEMFMSRGGHDENEDAMFSKKPLGGMSCASCEKDLINMYGKKVDYMPWSKLPFRDPSERIARVGQGFSKMLSMINPDQLSRYEGSKMPAEMQQQYAGTANNFYDPNAQADYTNQDEMVKTQTRFPQAMGGRVAMTSDGKRPGSAQVKKNIRGARVKR